MYKLVLLRHGESAWNKKGLFTGWTDVNLTTRGKEEAKEAGQELKKNGFVFDLAYTSFLKRASLTLKIALRELGQAQIPVKADWRLNERHYGNLQGLNKREMVKKFGEEQVLLWRRSYDVRPPKIDRQNLYNQQGDLKYKGIKVPEAESLKDVVARVTPFWQQEIIPKIKRGERVIIAASGNSLRAIVKYLDKITPREIAGWDIPTGIPLIYEFDRNLRVRRHYYLANTNKLQMAVDRVKNQIKN
ncbi:MAG: 2,3-diphosphoglycerate-dependent phosphoglycerate mutase [Patescibacteria group bacterium]|jgi:2,3-bisphosphoglycerate-dependent phosphoglycerate mutase